MATNTWSVKRQRQYGHIKDSLLQRGEGVDDAEEIAARTVNKQRAETGEAKTVPGERSYRELYVQAKARRIAGRSTMSKEELARRLAS
jgi:plasmid stabilization system protein ParE